MADMAAHDDDRLVEESEALPTSAQDLMARFADLDIEYKLYEHEPVFTVAESGHLDEVILGVHCRNLFLRDKKKKNYLVVVANETKIDIKKLQDLIGSSRLSFGSAERLWQYLGVRSGSVCPFAIVNDMAGEVEIILDKDMMEAAIVNYHPMENHMTVGLSPDDLMKFIEECNHMPRVLDMGLAAPDESSEKERE